MYVPVIEGDGISGVSTINYGRLTLSFQGEVVAYRKLSPMNEKSNNPSKIKLNVPPPLIHVSFITLGVPH